MTAHTTVPVLTSSDVVRTMLAAGWEHVTYDAGYHTVTGFSPRQPHYVRVWVSPTTDVVESAVLVRYADTVDRTGGRDVTVVQALGMWLTETDADTFGYRGRSAADRVAHHAAADASTYVPSVPIVGAGVGVGIAHVRPSQGITGGKAVQTAYAACAAVGLVLWALAPGRGRVYATDYGQRMYVVTYGNGVATARTYARSGAESFVTSQPFDAAAGFDLRDADTQAALWDIQTDTYPDDAAPGAAAAAVLADVEAERAVVAQRAAVEAESARAAAVIDRAEAQALEAHTAAVEAVDDAVSDADYRVSAAGRTVSAALATFTGVSCDRARVAGRASVTRRDVWDAAEDLRAAVEAYRAAAVRRDVLTGRHPIDGRAFADRGAHELEERELCTGRGGAVTRYLRTARYLEALAAVCDTVAEVLAPMVNQYAEGAPADALEHAWAAVQDAAAAARAHTGWCVSYSVDPMLVDTLGRLVAAVAAETAPVDGDVPADTVEAPTARIASVDGGGGAVCRGCDSHLTYSYRVVFTDGAHGNYCHECLRDLEAAETTAPGADVPADGAGAPATDVGARVALVREHTPNLRGTVVAVRPARGTVSVVWDNGYRCSHRVADVRVTVAAPDTYRVAAGGVLLGAGTGVGIASSGPGELTPAQRAAITRSLRTAAESAREDAASAREYLAAGDRSRAHEYAAGVVRVGRWAAAEAARCGTPRAREYAQLVAAAADQARDVLALVAPGVPAFKPARPVVAEHLVAYAQRCDDAVCSYADAIVAACGHITNGDRTAATLDRVERLRGRLERAANGTRINAETASREYPEASAWCAWWAHQTATRVRKVLEHADRVCGQAAVDVLENGSVADALELADRMGPALRFTGAGSIRGGVVRGFPIDPGTLGAGTGVGPFGGPGRLPIVDPAVAEVSTDRMYADREGDVWVWHEGGWRYTTDSGTFTVTDPFESLPTAFGPYVELSDNVARIMRGVLRGMSFRPFGAGVGVGIVAVDPEATGALEATAAGDALEGDDPADVRAALVARFGRRAPGAVFTAAQVCDRDTLASMAAAGDRGAGYALGWRDGWRAAIDHAAAAATRWAEVTDTV